MAEPKCPDCGLQGIDHIVSVSSIERAKNGVPWFNVAHCDGCGHVYGIFAKSVLTPNIGPRLVVPERK